MPESLEGRVAIVTGSSRGIGREFALRLAREGAHVVVTGKSEVGSERLPGSIHDVAAEVEALGVRALPLKVNVRETDEIEAMVRRTVAELGRLDVLVNNAGAMWWERILDTPPRRMALMYEVNLRASYLAAYHALPHMVRGGWGHVVMNSPPIVAGPYGFSLYNATKMGMTRLAIGIGAEHAADNVAGNSLWPATPIDSYATRNWPDSKMGRADQRRTPAIMCDALIELLTSAPRSCTARQLVDEPFLRERGWDDARIDAYWLEGRPADPLWIDGREALTAV